MTAVKLSVPDNARAGGGKILQSNPGVCRGISVGRLSACAPPFCSAVCVGARVVMFPASAREILIEAWRAVAVLTEDDGEIVLVDGVVDEALVTAVHATGAVSELIGDVGDAVLHGV